MAMIKYDEVAPNGVNKYTPEEFKGFKYEKLVPGQKKTIVLLARNVYPAKDENFEPLKSKIDGRIIMKKIIYIGFDDSTFTTVKYDVPVAQMESIVGNNDETDMVWDLKALGLDTKVKVISYMQKLGKKEYQACAFE